jgi:hypothetical protein
LIKGLFRLKNFLGIESFIIKITFSRIAMMAFAWLLCWTIFVRSNPEDHPWISHQELKYIQSNIVSNNNKHEKNNRSVPWVKICTSMPVLSVFVVKFTVNWNYILLLLKLPSYLQNVLKYPVDQVWYKPSNKITTKLSLDLINKRHNKWVFIKSD